MTKTQTPASENPVIELVPVTDGELVTVTGGRDYGWRGGGWGGQTNWGGAESGGGGAGTTGSW